MLQRTARGGRYSTVLLAAAALGVVALTGVAVWLLFSTGNAVAVSVPSVPAAASGSVQASCAALTAAAPQTVDNESRRRTSPSSPLTAAWGDPPITLRCGVPEPEILRPGSKTYDPSADEAYVNGIAWLIEKAPDGYRFTAAQRAIYVEVDVPSAYNPETAALVDFATAVTNTIPRDTGGFGADVAPAPTDGASTTAAPTPTSTPTPTS